jgi:prepilin-type N-terminal cleavage/methylation domain-containing protein
MTEDLSAYRLHGFTLVELSIVLVIVALLVGGVVSGRQLVRNAEVQKTFGEAQGFAAAANTFRVKYGCLPGDCA